MGDFDDSLYGEWTTRALAGEMLKEEDGLRILQDESLQLLLLLQAAFRVREHYFGRRVRVQVLNNVQNGYCPEDCHYCAQSVESSAAIQRYRVKGDEEILAEAERAWQAGMYRYCMVLSGRGPNTQRVEHMADLVRRIKSRWPIEVCLSAGFIDQAMAALLKEAGLDRYNHNLNTAEGHYGAICRTHTYQDRLATLQAARAQGLEVCSGLIVGMGESDQDIVTVASTLRSLQARSIPVNFYMHIPGSPLGDVAHGLTPERCLRILCLFRFLNPDAEIRAAGGRELHLRSLAALALYPANGLFSAGYLNVGGQSTSEVQQMIQDAGFTVEVVEEAE
ncbi:biotin synthase BioB [Candidatus Magnetaquicoccus inordinatus]|uniref:biotin synthase BioB n=1 Tax=Candidatus Magnetaquicoccus inordinatus TaxID=2496818 RepID=UPI00102C1902|nr:biotin synthase BioB [Candidatus Magnetaquicoccus inordinatus]